MRIEATAAGTRVEQEVWDTLNAKEDRKQHEVSVLCAKLEGHPGTLGPRLAMLCRESRKGTLGYGLNAFDSVYFSRRLGYLMSPSR